MSEATFPLDTSGAVCIETARDHGSVATRLIRWSDLSPFEQGYVEAMLTGYGIPSLGFSSIHPETLARAVEDCRRGKAIYTKGRRDDGRHFWRWRQSEGARHGFPPLRFLLGDDGRLYLREA